MRTTLFTLAIALLACGTTLAASTNTTVSTSNKWAWSSSSGWLNCRTDITNGVAVGEYVLSGYMYSPTIGWIHLGDGTPTNGVRYCNNSAVDYGVNHDGAGHLSGYAWGPSAGWINFGWTNQDAPQAPKINLQNGMFSGYAWGASVGWISLSNISAKLQTVKLTTGPNEDNDGIPDAWEIQWTGSTNLLRAGLDYDGDGYADDQEYILDTCPTNPADALDFAGIVMSGGTNFCISWFGRPTRFYRIEKKNDLMEPYWVDSGLGWFVGLSDSAVTCAIPCSASTQGFFRLRAARPLP